MRVKISFLKLEKGKNWIKIIIDRAKKAENLETEKGQKG